MADEDREALERDLLDFVKERFFGGDPKGALDRNSPLQDWGILDSINSAILLNHIHNGLVVQVPIERIEPRSFTSVSSIAEMLLEARRGSGQ